MTNQQYLLCKLFIIAALAISAPGCSAETAQQEAATVTPQTPIAAPKAAAPTIDAVAPAEFQFVKPNLSEDELRAGWISLFDGSTLFGWDVPSGTNWHVEDGCITADAGDISLLLTPFAFGDFEFRCDFHLAAGGNSGVFLRTAEGKTDPAKTTYELNICDSHKSHGTGSLVGRHVAEGVPAVEGAWHTFHVTCSGANIKVVLDDEQIVDFTDKSDATRSSGRIGLQMNQGRVAFKNVFLRPLTAKDLFNGKDLTGFREVPGSKGTFVVRDDVIHAESGPGFIETEATFGDFILHVEANIHDAKAIADGRPANSGVFFRAIAGTEKAPSHGYEMQIQHDFKGGDRAQPLDFGSGGIYRREPARYVVADNNAWFTETLIAQGNRFATFVNGYQVLDWTDERAPDENPRKGLRLEAGQLSLQGHDPTTDVDFRAIRVHELPAR
jgi:hypothetical protein